MTNPRYFGGFLAPQVGLEPTTFRLTVAKMSFPIFLYYMLSYDISGVSALSLFLLFLIFANFVQLLGRELTIG